MEKKRLLYTINRFDQFYDNVNNKTAIYIAINTFIVGLLLAVFNNMDEFIVKYQILFIIILALTLLLGITTIVILIYASI